MGVVFRALDLQPFLVGRPRDHDSLTEAYAEARSKRTLTVLVRGPSGAGKSALVRHMAETWRGYGALVLEGRCYENERIPFKALDGVLNELTAHLRRLPDALVATMLCDEVAALVRLFPGLRRVPAIEERFPKSNELPVSLHEPAARGLCLLLCALSKRAPVVLVIADLQWGDTDSVPLLRALSAMDTFPGVLLLGTYRTDVGSEESALVASLLSRRGLSASQPDVRLLDLPPLAVCHARLRTSTITGSAADVDAIEEVGRQGQSAPADRSGEAATRTSTITEGSSNDRATLGQPERFEVLRSAVEREEHTANLIRMRKAMWSGVLLWPLYFASDYLVSQYAGGASFSSYACLRLAAWLLIAGCLVVLHTHRLSPRALLVLDTVAYGGTTTALSLMCALHDGLTAPYTAGVLVIMTIRAAFLAMPWRMGLWSLGAITISYPAVILGSAAIHGKLARLLAEPAELTLFLYYNALILTTFAATLIGGHAVWALRRQVFEARNIGRYRLLRPLARGGMGEIWVAHDVNVRRTVALKILRSDQHSDVALKRFEREVEATSELTHPNTIRVFDYGVTDDGLWYYAMELLEGEDLAQAIARQGPLSQSRCVNVMLQVCGALAEAHARGIVHRDIKPGNVFLCQGTGLDDSVKVLDFGIAKRAGNVVSTELTNVDRMIGTPAYVSPEVAIGRAADVRSDVYGLGGLFYFLLTGRAPFAGTQTALLIAHAMEQPALPSTRTGAAIDPALEAIVMRCLQKVPGERFASAGELLAALQHHQAHALPTEAIATSRLGVALALPR